MNDGATFAEFFSRLGFLTNQMKSCVKRITKNQKVEKVLRAQTPKFYHTIMAIEESKDLIEMKLEELQASLETHELSIKQRNHDHASFKQIWKIPLSKNKTLKL